MMKDPRTGELVGLCVDLLKHLSDELGFSYSITLVKDNTYGELDEATMKWNGMIREIIDHVSWLGFCRYSEIYPS